MLQICSYTRHLIARLPIKWLHACIYMYTLFSIWLKSRSLFSACKDIWQNLLLMHRLANLLIEETKFLYGVSGEIVQMQAEFKRMQCFLRDADARQDEENIHSMPIYLRLWCSFYVKHLKIKLWADRESVISILILIFHA